MQTLTPQEEGACVGTEMSGGQPLSSCRTSNLNPSRLTSRRSQPPLALSVPLSRFTSRVGGGSAFFVRRRYKYESQIVIVDLPTLDQGLFRRRFHARCRDSFCRSA